MSLPGLDLRDGVRGLTVLARRDLHALYQQVQTFAEARVALNDVLPALIVTYGAAAATLAADWYDETRVKADAKGRFRAIPADIPNSGAHELAVWATGAATSPTEVEALVFGGMQRRIANFSRDTITGSSVADPASRGWQRVGTGECAFCALLIGRGFVYTEATANFAAHDSCACSAVSAWRGQSIPVKPYKPGPRHGNEADYARAREYIASH